MAATPPPRYWGAGYKVLRVKNPSQTHYVADGLEGNGFAYIRDCMAPDMRHNMRASMSYIDGHADSVWHVTSVSHKGWMKNQPNGGI